MPRVLPAFVWTRRQAVRVVIMLLSAVAGVALWRSDVGPDPARADVVWQVDLGLFSALLTALTIVFAVTVTPQTRWPSFGDLVSAIAVTSWLTVATVGIVCAAAGDVLASPGLAAAGIVFTLVQLGFGLDTLWVLMRFRSAAGRRAILVRLTTRRLHRAAAGRAWAGAAQHPELADLREEIEYSIDRNDVAELAARVEEIVEGCSRDTTVGQARYRLAVMTHLLERLGRSVLFESLSGDAARAAVPPLVRGVLRASWQVTAFTFPDRAAPERDEVPAAVALGQICRVVGWLQACAHERLQSGVDDPAARQIVAALSQGRSRIVQFVDPDPPGFFRAPHDPWPYGFSDPAAVLVWLASMCEFNGSHVGNGLYILCEVLTGERFFGNYWHGDCIFSEIDRRLGAARERPAAAVLDSCGGLGAVSLELAATVISGLRDRRLVPPTGWENDPNFSTDRRYLRSQQTLFATYDCLPDATAAMDWLAEALTSAPTRPSLGAMVTDAFVRYGEPTRLPLRGLGERPASATLAALIRLMVNRPREAEALLGMLPPPMLAGALQQARFVFSDAGPGQPVAQTWGRQAARLLGPRPGQERELLDIIGGVLADD